MNREKVGFLDRIKELSDGEFTALFLRHYDRFKEAEATMNALKDQAKERAKGQAVMAHRGRRIDVMSSYESGWSLDVLAELPVASRESVTKTSIDSGAMAELLKGWSTSTQARFRKLAEKLEAFRLQKVKVSVNVRAVK